MSIKPLSLKKMFNNSFPACDADLNSFHDEVAQFLHCILFHCFSDLKQKIIVATVTIVERKIWVSLIAHQMLK